jgi:hypothetical protein
MTTSPAGKTNWQLSRFKYLGITLQTSKTSFTPHIQNRVAAAIQAIHDTSNLSLLSIGTATVLFNLSLTYSNLWDTADLARPHGTESKEAGKHKSYVSEKSTVHLKVHTDQTSVHPR